MAQCKHWLTYGCVDCVNLVRSREEVPPNFEDVHLTASGQEGTWLPVQFALAAMDQADEQARGRDFDAIEALMSDTTEGGGLRGLDPEYHVVRAGLIKLGATA